MRRAIFAALVARATVTALFAGEPTLSLDDIRNSRFADPGAEPIWQFYVKFWTKQSAPGSSEKELQALAKLPPKLRDVCLLLRYELEFGNGGTQGAALLDDLESSARLLRMTAAAYARFGDKERERMMREILSRLAGHTRTLEEAERSGKLDGYVSPLNAYDRPWEAVEYDYVAAIRKSMKAHPADYIWPQPAPR